MQVLKEEVLGRWTVGSGGFIGEVYLRSTPPEALPCKRKGVPLVFLTDLWVHPLRRGLGWSRSLVSAAVAHADKQRWDLWLYARPFNNSKKPERRLNTDQLVTLYLSFGFELSNKCALQEPVLVRRCPTPKP